MNPNFPAQIEETGLVISSDKICAVKEKNVDQFHETLSDDLGPDWMEIPGKAMHIHLHENATPSQISVARLVPLLKLNAAAKVISDMLDKQVFTKLTKPTPGCAPGFFAPKPNGTSVRLVTDYTKLNKFVKRPIHPFPSGTDIMQGIPESAKYFSKFDAVHGYFQLAINEESRYHISHSVWSLNICV